MGRARDIRRRVAAEDDAYDALVRALIDPVMARLRRYPQRALRQQTLIDFVQRWRYMHTRDWRLAIDARLSKGFVYIRDVRLSAGKMKRGDWEDAESDIGAMEIIVTIDGNKARLQANCLCCLSLHALARRLQRHPDGTLESLLFDINLVAEAVAREPLEPGAGYKVHTDDEGGGWRGRVVNIASANEVVPVLSIRTWIEQ